MKFGVLSLVCGRIDEVEQERSKTIFATMTIASFLALNVIIFLETPESKLFKTYILKQITLFLYIFHFLPNNSTK